MQLLRARRVPERRVSSRFQRRVRIPEWSVEDIGADITKIGLSGSPTKVKSVESIVLTASEAKILSDSDDDIDMMIKELIEKHTIG